MHSAGIALWCCLLAINVTIITLSSIMLNRVKVANELSTVNLDVVEQIESDWIAVPFVDIVIDENACPAETEAVFSKTWGGTEEGCLIQNLFGSQVITMDEYQRKDRDDRPQCGVIFATPPVV